MSQHCCHIRVHDLRVQNRKLNTLISQMICVLGCNMGIDAQAGKLPGTHIDTCVSPRRTEKLSLFYPYHQQIDPAMNGSMLSKCICSCDVSCWKSVYKKMSASYIGVLCNQQ